MNKSEVRRGAYLRQLSAICKKNVGDTTYCGINKRRKKGGEKAASSLKVSDPVEREGNKGPEEGRKAGSIRHFE